MLANGISEEVFWTLTPRKLGIYHKAIEKRKKNEDYDRWHQGAYFMVACSVAIDHALNGRKARSEYLEKPFSEMENQEEFFDASNLPEEEKEKLRQQLFGYLGDLQTSHEQAERLKKVTQ